jgi:hypothetical protein
MELEFRTVFEPNFAVSVLDLCGAGAAMPLSADDIA